MKLFPIIITVLFISSQAPCLSQTDAPDLKAFIMRANDEILNKGNYDYISEIFADAYHRPGATVKGPGYIRGLAKELHAAFPDLEVRIENVIQEGSWIAWRRVHTGTHKGKILGFAPTGKKLTWECLVFTHIAGGKIVYEVGQHNLTERLREATYGQ